MGKPRICVLPPLSLLTTKELKIFQYRWKFLRLAGFVSHPLRYLSSTTTLPNGPKKWAQCRSDEALASRIYSSVQLTGFQSNFSPKRTIFQADVGRLATKGQLNHRDFWSGRW